MSSLILKKQNKTSTEVRLCLPAQEAAPGQAISVALGQYGVKLQEFIKDFNAKTQNFIKGSEISIIVFVNKDGSFKTYIKGPSLDSILSLFAKDIKKNKLIIYRILIPFIRKNRFDLISLSDLAIYRILVGSLNSRNKK